MILANKLLRATAGVSFDFWLVKISTSIPNNTVTVSAYDPSIGFLVDQVLQLPARSVTAYRSFNFSANGKYLVFTEHFGTDSSTRTCYVHVYDVSMGPGSITHAGTYAESGQFAFQNAAISPNGSRICIGPRGSSYAVRVIDISESIEAPTVLATHAANAFGSNMSGRGLYTPAGDIIILCGTSKFTTLVGEAMSPYVVGWASGNSARRSWNYDGARNFVADGQINTDWTSFTYALAPTSTSPLGNFANRRLVDNENEWAGASPLGANPNEGIDGLPYILTRTVFNSGGTWNGNGPLRVIDYTNGAEAYVSPHSSDGHFWPNGLIQHFNPVTGLWMLLDPTDSFIDVSADFSEEVTLTDFKTFWPVYGKQTLHTTL